MASSTSDAGLPGGLYQAGVSLGRLEAVEHGHPCGALEALERAAERITRHGWAHSPAARCEEEELTLSVGLTGRDLDTWALWLAGYLCGFLSATTGRGWAQPAWQREADEDGPWLFRLQAEAAAGRQSGSDTEPLGETAQFYLGGISGSLVGHAISLTDLIQNCADAILILDIDHRVRFWNRGAQEIFGYTPEQAVGRYFDLLLPDDLKSSGELSMLARQTLEQGAIRNYITRRITRDGRTLWVSLTRTLLHDRDGKVVGSSAILRDITEQRRMAQELARVQSMNMVDQLANTVANEIKNPLAGIYGAIQILEATAVEHSTRDQIYENVGQEIRRMDQSIKDLMRFASRTQPNLLRLTIRELVDQALELVRDDPVLEGVAIEADGSNALAMSVDPALFEQAMVQLLHNAGQAFEQDDRQVRITWTEDKGQVRLSVEDNGPGIPPETRERLFEPFFTTRAHGSGLGLPICRKNVEAHGGSIEVAAEPGKGTRFTLIFPLDGGRVSSKTPTWE